jgi:tRNA pseudouridine55 synthase
MEATSVPDQTVLSVNGWLILDKPVGLTSASAVNRVRRALGAGKAGHGGTLDPLASGILPIALGEATKTVPYVMDRAKRYRFAVRFGAETDTDDAEGAVSARSAHRPSAADIEAKLERFTGVIDQVPPTYSAIKVGGRRAYDLAREAQPVSLAARQVRVDRLVLSGMPDPDTAEFDLDCGKGVYVRSLARDLARALGTCGHVVCLRRLAVGPFDEARAISLELLESLGHSAAASGHLLPLKTALDDIPALALTEAEANLLRHGQSVALLKRSDRDRLGSAKAGDTVVAVLDEHPVALTRLEAGMLMPVRVLNL